MEYLLTGAEMAGCDRRTSEYIGIPSLVLMERAALSVADGVEQYLKRSGAANPLVLAVAGRGNNGADALAAGRILLDRGYNVEFCRLSGEVSPESSFAVQERILNRYGCEVRLFQDSCRLFQAPDVIIDGLFGTGLSRALKGEAVECVQAVNRCRDLCGTYVVAVDLPSGISSDNGRVMGCAVRCDETRTFAFYKRGHFLYPGCAYAGDLHLAQIGITERAFEKTPDLFTFLKEKAGELLPARSPGGNKGTFGRILLLAGRRNMCGAAILAARACMSAGAGMVKIFTEEANRTIVQQMLPEALLQTYEPFHESLPDRPADGTGGAISEGDSDTSSDHVREIRQNFKRSLLEALEWADIAAAGPAMGTDETAIELLRTVLEKAGDPGCRLRGLVLDADALRILAGSEDLRGLLAGRRETVPCILTPHMAEFAALSGKSVGECIEERFRLVPETAEKLRCVIACKDARTLTAGPKTISESSRMYLNCSGNSGMATAGSGDVLTGMTAAFLALFTMTGDTAETADGRSARTVRPLRSFAFSAEEKQNGFAAACCAVYLHGRAGDIACREYGAQGMKAGDLIRPLRSASFWEQEI